MVPAAARPGTSAAEAAGAAEAAPEDQAVLEDLAVLQGQPDPMDQVAPVRGSRLG